MRKALLIATLMAALHTLPASAKEDRNEALYTAARSGNADKVARILADGVSADARVVALSVAASNNQPGAFKVLWIHDNSDVAPAALDYALCYAYRDRHPAAEIAEVLQARSLTTESCCNGNSKHPYCAKKPIRLTSQQYAPAQCATVFVDSAEVPQGATRIATLWDERSSLFDPASADK